MAIPALDQLGYRFAGGRMVATAHGPALLLLYGGASGEAVALLTRPMEVDNTAPMAATRRDGVGRMSWATAGMGFSLVGPDRPDLLNRAAAEVRRQVEQS